MSGFNEFRESETQRRVLPAQDPSTCEPVITTEEYKRYKPTGNDHISKELFQAVGRTEIVNPNFFFNFTWSKQEFPQQNER